MARPPLLCLIFLMDALLIVTVASSINPQPPASSPASINVRKQEAPQIRKVGKHRNKAISFSAAPGLSPSQAPHTQTKENLHFPEAISSSAQKSSTTQLRDTHMAQHHHHSFDKSVAGGGLMLGGLGTVFLVAIVCYIRATRRKNTEPTGPVADVAIV